MSERCEIFCQCDACINPQGGDRRSALHSVAYPAPPDADTLQGPERCGCDESLELRRALRVMRSERDYLLAFADPKEVAQMRRELAAEWEAEHDH